MSDSDQYRDGLILEEWLQSRKEAAKHIEPDTAEVCWEHGYTMDPYDTWSDMPDEYKLVGRIYFARAPESEIWVWFGDLPAEIREKLCERNRHGLAPHFGDYRPLSGDDSGG